MIRDHLAQGTTGQIRLFSLLDTADRRVLYVLVLLSLAIPIISGASLKPAPMQTAADLHDAVEALDPASGKIAWISFDWGPGTSAENRPQTELAVEHLMRKRIPFVVVTLYQLAPPFLRELPRTVADRLEQEFPGEKWEYGKDWVNFGYRQGGLLEIQKLAKAKDLHEVLTVDAGGIPVAELPLMQKVHKLSDIAMLMQFSGLVGVFNAWLQYFQTSEYQPKFVHGCTSITIPEAYIYYESKQIQGLLEGAAGAAWYEWMLKERFPQRSKKYVAIPINTGLSYAQLVIIAFIFLGNLGVFLRWWSERSGKS